MKRRMISLMLLLLLLSQSLFPALATEAVPEKTRICASYWEHDVLYTFAQFALDDPVSQEVKLIANGYTDKQHPENINDAEGALHYMLLIDTSPSMPQYRGNILAFAQALMNTQQNIKVSVAGFNETFSVVNTEMTQWSDVSAALWSLSYQVDGTDIGGCVADALVYLAEQGYEPGVMTNLVVITDGESWYSDDSELEKAWEDHARQEAAAAMALFPEIVVHTYSFKAWNSDVQETLHSSNGLHWVGGAARSAGAQLAEYSDAMYVIPFCLPGYGSDEFIPDSLRMTVGTTNLSFGDVRNVSIMPKVTRPEDPTVPPESTLPADPSEPSENTAPTEVTDPANPTEGTEPMDPTEVTSPEESFPATEPTGEEIKESQETTDGTTSTDGKSEPLMPCDFNWTLCVALVVAILLICLIVVLLISVRNKRGQAYSTRIRIEVTRGGRIRVKDIYFLNTELLIGASKKCDIVIPTLINPVCGKIIQQGQLIYIEDVGAPDGILLNGMRIFAPNRLRSGDEITIASTSFRVLF